MRTAKIRLGTFTDEYGLSIEEAMKRASLPDFMNEEDRSLLAYIEAALDAGDEELAREPSYSDALMST